MRELNFLLAAVAALMLIANVTALASIFAGQPPRRTREPVHRVERCRCGQAMVCPRCDRVNVSPIVMHETTPVKR